MSEEVSINNRTVNMRITVQNVFPAILVSPCPNVVHNTVTQPAWSVVINNKNNSNQLNNKENMTLFSEGTISSNTFIPSWKR